MPRGRKMPVERSDGKRYTSLTMAAHAIVAHDGCGTVDGVKSNISHSINKTRRQNLAYGYDWRYLTECAGCDFAGVPGVCPTEWSWPEYGGEAFGPIADKLPIPDDKEPHELCLSWKELR